MSNDSYHTETYTHKCGKKYHVELYYDHDMGAPQTEGDGYGVTVRMDWNPTDEEQLEQHINDYEPELEEETRLRMMRVLSRTSNWRDSSGLYYDVLSSLHKARTEGWGAGAEWKAANPTATKEEELMHIVDKDFEHLYGWYDDDWHWVTVSVAPLNEDDEPMEDHREYCGGYESTITDHDQRKWFDEVIEDLIHSVEHSLKKVLHKGQMELSFA
jgi:hypothetical protein